MEWWESGDIREGVPFAVDATGVWRDVDEVPRGKSCGCFCGDCHGPLIARHGEVRAHHFAHDDRRDCRHALEAALYGMAMSLLGAPGAMLATPACGERRQLAIDAGAALCDLADLPSEEFVVPADTLSLAGATFRSPSIAESTPTQPEIFLPQRGVAIHLLSFQKSFRQLTSLPDVAVLGVNLGAYARLLWQVCDERKDQRIKDASQARDLMREWLAEDFSGRGWLYHPEVEKEKQRLRAWIAAERAKFAPRVVPDDTDESYSDLEEPNPVWLVPPKEGHPDPGAFGWIATGSGLVPGTPEFMKTIRSDVRVGDSRAAELGLFWHTRRSSWFFVGLADAQVPSSVWGLLDPLSDWEPVLRTDRENLHRVRTRPTTSDPSRNAQGLVTPFTSAPVALAPSPPIPDEILLRNVGTCYCGAPLNEVRFAKGFFEGRRAWICSNNSHHPMKMV